jgi:hypothetical protein
MQPRRRTSRHRATLLVLPLLLFLASRAGALGVDSVTLLPASPTTVDRLQVTIVGSAFGCNPGFNQSPQVSGGTIRIDGATPSPCLLFPPVPPNYWSAQVLAGPLAAGDHTLDVYIDQTFYRSVRFTVTVWTANTELFLGQERFRVDVNWQDPQSKGSGYAQPFSDESGYFWFFEPGNVEITVKILDGRPINGHFWVFIASMTNVAFKVVVTDTANQLNCPLTGATNCPTRTYVNPLSTNQNFIDINAF